jgi:hypothetical protein
MSPLINCFFFSFSFSKKYIYKTVKMDVDKLRPIPGIPFPQYYELMMDWKTPIAIAATYAICVHLFNPSAASAKLSRVEAKNRGVGSATKSSKAMTAFVFVHNLILAVYSGVTFINMAYNMHKLFNRGSSLHDSVSILYWFVY